MPLRTVGVAALLTLALLLIYVPDIGHGFIRDDFMWVLAGHVSGADDVARILQADTGFYRPLVTLSFSLDRALFGLHPFGYALTNTLLLLACAALVSRVARAFGLDWWAAVAAGALWAFNVHGVNMALLWISGRTALLLCLFVLLTALAALRGRWWQAGTWCLLALLSKEEAVTLPFLLAVWTWYSGRHSAGARVHAAFPWRTLPLLLALLVYVVLRSNTGAFGPLSAPYYYRFTTAPAVVARNIREYADRALTFTAAVSLIAWVASRVRPRWQPADRRIVTFAGLWLIAAYALTVFLPIRSSLYALFPSIAAALVGALILQRLHDAAPRRMRLVLPLLMLMPFLLIPVYRQRNQRWVEPADVSRVLVTDLQALGTTIRPGTHLVAIDTADQQLDSVFSGLFGDAVALYVGNGVTGELVSLSDATARPPADNATWIRLQPDGHLGLSTVP